MKVIITGVFRKKYLKTLSRYFSEAEFIEFLRAKNHAFLSLRRPYFKIKWYVKTISIRWVLFLLDGDRVVPLMIFLKKDKKYGYNIKWELLEDEILFAYKESLVDIANWDYEEF